MRRTIGVIAALGIIAGAATAAPAQAQEKGPFDAHFYYYGQWISGYANTYSLGVISTSGNTAYVPPGHDTGDYQQSTSRTIPAPWYYGSTTFKICYRVRTNYGVFYTRSSVYPSNSYRYDIWASPNKIGQCAGS